MKILFPMREKGKQMDRKIKTLLKLDRIPNFKLSEKERILLDEWKAQQKPVEIKPKKTYTRRKKTTNEVKEEDKEVGDYQVEITFES